jgi:iron complex transport system substrate-binding protein
MKKILFWMMVSGMLFAGERIVTLAPAVNEIVYALGEGKHVVGNTTHAVYPEASKAVPKVGGYFAPSLEKIVALEPTLVLMQKNNLELKKSLERFGIKVVMVKIDSLAGIKNAFVTIGGLLGRQSQADAIVGEIDGAIRELKKLPRTNKTMLIAFGRQQDLSKPIYVAGNDLYFNEVITLAGLSNALRSERPGQPVLGMEGIISTDPDIVLILSPYSRDLGIAPETIKREWLALPVKAAKAKQVYVIDEPYCSMPSDRIIPFLHHVKRIVEGFNDSL